MGVQQQQGATAATLTKIYAIAFEIASRHADPFLEYTEFSG